MTPDQLEAVRSLGESTNGRFNIFLGLAGPGKAAVRAKIMSLLVGKKMPQSKSGVNAVRDEFYKISAPEGTCEAVRAESFAKWCKAIQES